MGVKDTVTKDYMNDPRIFADAFNYFLYSGRQVILPEKLHSIDTTMIGIPYGADGAGMPVQKFRDNMKCLSAMTDDHAAYMILGVEEQSDIHYAMPVKDMVYDSLHYASQVEEAARSHRRESGKNREDKAIAEECGLEEVVTGKKVSSGEYLTGFYKEDRLIPVITLVVYFGPDKWDAPVCLHEMLSVTDEEILAFVPDYKINLITPEGMSDEELDMFRTSLREVLMFIKYSKDKKQLKEHVENDPAFKNVEQKAGQVINVMTGVDFKMSESEEYVDMCQAMREIREDERREGREEGLKEGREEGLKEGLKEGIEASCRETILRMLSMKVFSYEQIAEVNAASVEEVKKLAEQKME